jgi:FAD dependent oxidoreductase
MHEEHFDVVVVGASLGGVAAALRASAMGASVCLLEATSWIGGQYSAQGLTRGDETEWINKGIGATELYLRFRTRAQAYYSANFTLSAGGKKLSPFDPGAPDARYATNLRVAPRAAHEVMKAMLAEATPAIAVRTEMPVHAVEMVGTRVRAVIARPFYGAETRFTGAYVLDATDLGELLGMANVPHRLGADSKDDFGEPNAPAQRHPGWIQPITVPLALERRPEGENHTIPKPDGYDETIKARPFKMQFGNSGVFRVTGSDSLFNYRQFIAAKNFADAAFRYDLTTINDVSNDYFPRSIPTGNPDLDAAIVVAARDRSRAYAYWLQTACPRDDGKGHGYPNLRVATEVFGTYDGTAPQPYIRESRRIVARTTVRQQDIVVEGLRAKPFADSCGIGYYRLDMHTVEGMNGYDGKEPAKCQIPLGALVAPAVENLLPACKNLGVTHITNSAYRVHPIEWNVGEAAGALAAFCIRRGVAPGGLLDQPAMLRDFRHALLDAGVPLYWWTDLPHGKDPALFTASQLVAVNGLIMRPESLHFDAAEPVGDAERAAIDVAAKAALPWPSQPLGRGEAAAFLVQHLGL